MPIVNIRENEIIDERERQKTKAERNKGVKHGLLYLHRLTLRILKKKIVGQIFKRSFASK